MDGTDGLDLSWFGTGQDLSGAFDDQETGNIFQDGNGLFQMDPLSDPFQFGDTTFSGIGSSSGGIGSSLTAGAAALGTLLHDTFAGGSTQPIITTTAAQPSFLASAPLGIPIILWLVAGGLFIALHNKKG
ncbi:MAG TPA: hypothetical protein VGG10_15280 [Rhizomicrobium sp.]|jgi:hypothetical protein